MAACPFIVIKMFFHHSSSETDQRKVRYHRVNLSGRNWFENKVTQDWSHCNELKTVANTWILESSLSSCILHPNSDFSMHFYVLFFPPCLWSWGAIYRESAEAVRGPNFTQAGAAWVAHTCVELLVVPLSFEINDGIKKKKRKRFC